MKSIVTPSIRVAVVDHSPHDYRDFLAASSMSSVSIHFLPNGNDTLRFARRVPSGLWVINTQLPDMSGFDLAQMLRSLRPSALVFMIGDEYRLDDEMQTFTLGLAKYLCKPLEPSWILPQSDDFCIPLHSHRHLTNELRVVASRQNEIAGIPTGPALGPTVTEEWDAGQVILPFNPKARRRPAA